MQIVTSSETVVTRSCLVYNAMNGGIVEEFCNLWIAIEASSGLYFLLCGNGIKNAHRKVKKKKMFGLASCVANDEAK